MKKLVLVQPFLFAIFPILSLFASNVKLVGLGEIVAPMIIVVCLTGLSLLVATRLLRDSQAAAVTVSIFWVLFFSYGRVLNAIGGPAAGRDRHLLLVWVALFAGSTFAVARWRRPVPELARIMTIVGLVLVAMPVVTAVPALIPRRGTAVVRPANSAPLAQADPRTASDRSLAQPKGKLATETRQEQPGQVAVSATLAQPLGQAPAADTPSAEVAQAPAVALLPKEPKQKPSIYYIVLDGYARADVLQELYQYDNSEFIDGLEKRGFYVAARSRANYCQTYLSLASSLNCTYLDEVAERAGEASDDRRPLQEMLKNNAVTGFLREQGYTYVAFSSGYAEAELRNADLYVTAPWSLTQFQSGLINTTPISPLVGLQYEGHRQRILYVLDHLADTTSMEPPLFVFAHLTAPHPPFVFGPQGEKITPNRDFLFADGSHYMAEGSRTEYEEGYKGQLSYINKRVVATIDAILASSPAPPIIILQADHGPGLKLNWYSFERTDPKERMSIFNAYYLPGDGQKQVYESITPVNTFRIIFNQYLGTDYELLEDQSYFSLWDRPYQFIPVPAE